MSSKGCTAPSHLATLARMKTANPLLVSIAEAGFQLDLPSEDVNALIQNGNLTAVRIRGHLLVRYDSLVKFVRRAMPVRGTDLRSMTAGACTGQES